MKNFKILMCLISVVFTSCATTKMNTYSINEQIYSIVYQPEQNGIGKVYAIGEKYDYKITPCQDSPNYIASKMIGEVETAPISSCMESVEFIKRHKNDIAAVSLNFNIDNVASSNEVKSGFYNAIFSREKYSKFLIKEKNNTIKDLTINERKTLHLSNEEYIKISIPFEGIVVKLNNKNEILEQGKLKTPLLVNISVRELKKGYSVTPALKGVASIVLAPVALVLLIPYVAIIGHCESTVC